MNCNRISALKTDWTILFIFLAALSIRLLYIFQVLRFPLTEFLASSNVFDQGWFDSRALDIVSGHWAGNEVFIREPLYSYFLAIIYTIFKYSHPAAYIMQAILTSIGAILLYKIAAQVFNKKAALISAFIFSFYSISIYYDAMLLRENMITFLNILLLFFILKALKENKTISWLAAGSALGFLTLARHNILLPFILAFILFTLRPFKKALKYCLFFSLGMFIVFLPVLIRNYTVSNGNYVGISKEISAFWAGNNYRASGVDVDLSSEYHHLLYKSEGNTRKMAMIFLNEIKKRPKVYAKLYLRKIWMFFNGYEAPSNDSYDLYREEFPTVLRLPLFNFQFVCAFCFLGLFLSLFMKPRPYILYTFLIALSSLVILFNIQSRYRLSVAPFFIIFAGYSIYFIFDKIKNKDYLKPIVLIIISIFFYVILKPDLTYAGFRGPKNKIRPLDRTNLALAYLDYYQKNKDHELLKKALRQCNLALEEEKTFSATYALKGYIYFSENNYPASINELKKALVRDNRSPYLYNELGLVYCRQRSYSKAILFIKRALCLSPENKDFKELLSIIPVRPQ